MKIKLYGKIIFAEDLEYNQAAKALELASNNKAVEHLDFYIEETKKGWNLVGSCRDLKKSFIQSPEEYYIKI